MKLRRITQRVKKEARGLVDRVGHTRRRFGALVEASVGSPGSSHHVLVAPPGAGNIGDQAMVEAFVAAADKPVTIITRARDDFHLPADLAEHARIEALPNLFYGQGSAHERDVRALGRVLTGAASVSIIGADIMDGVYTLRPSIRRATLAASAARRGFDTTVIGFSWNSAAPRPAWDALRAAGQAGARLLLRDPESARRVRDAGIVGVVETADIVFTDDRLAPVLPDVAASLPRPYALVNASGLIARTVDQVPEYALLIEELRSRGLHVVLLPHVIRTTADDLLACRGVAASVGGAGVTLIEEMLAPSVIRTLADAATVTITGRMHLAVMSLSRGVPAVTVATQGKVEGLMRLFDWPELCVTPRRGMGEEMVAVVRSILDSDDSRARVERGLVRARGAARANIERIGAGAAG
ncbi:hypothetical protein DEA06_12685 [Microbacterium sp. Gd 4-13]|nr:hypothetical protein DEA06_12685 [Microbacterium sp. Gd 4-13]